MGMKINFNRSMLEASLMNLAELASSNASRSLRRAAINIRDLARAYAPADTHTLENAIDYATTRGAKGRNVFIVYVNEDMLHPNGRGKRVGDYAQIMEEQLHPFGRAAPGQRYFRLRKTSKNGAKVGGKFLARAVKEGSRRIVEDVATIVRQTLGSRLAGVAYHRDTQTDNDQ